MNTLVFRCALLLILVFPIAVGCSEQTLPGMPKLYKTQVTITQDGQPLAGANVIAINEDFASSPWSSGGTTDSAGVVHLRTEGKFTGVPIGTYKIAVTKLEDQSGIVLPEKIATDAEIAEYERLQRQAEAATFQVIDDKFGNLETTPLRLEVKGVTSQTFDVSPKVKIKPKKVPAG